MNATIFKQIMDLYDEAESGPYYDKEHDTYHVYEDGCECGYCADFRNNKRVLAAELKCSTCGAFERNESMFCSNSFHCCRVCKWDEGKIVALCQAHEGQTGVSEKLSAGVMNEAK